MNSFRLILVCFILMGCSQHENSIGKYRSPYGSSRPIEMSSYCWRSDSFITKGYDYLKLIQFVGNDMAIYKMLYDDGEMLFCAYPVDVESLKSIAESKGIPYSHYDTFIP